MARKDEINEALVTAASEGSLVEVLKLLAKGADINHVGDLEGGMTALQSAAKYGHADLVELLINKGADIEAKDNDGRTVLMHAA
ncbi:MAG: ankyrin repeat domain-containing protein, partial [Candidatus Zixiibacteriota bacterium]